MSARTRDWLKFGTLVAITFVFGLAFASALNLPKRGGAAEVAVPPQAVTAAAPAPIAVSKAVVDLGARCVRDRAGVRPSSSSARP